MINNQNEFNEKYNNKKITKIEIRRSKNFQGELVIEGYSELESLNLRDNKSIEQVILKNLPQLQECTIWNCGMKNLVIEKCPNTKTLNVRKNLLTNLEFLKSLENLEKLEIDGNTEISSGLEYLIDELETFSYENTNLTEVLKPYGGNWKAYWRDIKELKEFATQNLQGLLENIQSLKKEINKLKENQPITIDNPTNFEKKYQELKGSLNFLIEEEELKSKEIDKLVTNDILENIKNLKEDLFKTQKN